MSYLHDDVLDQGIKYIDDYGERLYICSAEPSTYTEAVTTYGLGNKNPVTISAPQAGDGAGARKVTVSAITDGSVTANGTASHWAIVDTTNTKLLATAALDASKSVNNGDTFTTPAFDIEQPPPA